jgi:hypothetical protein
MPLWTPVFDQVFPDTAPATPAVHPWPRPFLDVVGIDACLDLRVAPSAGEGDVPLLAFGDDAVVVSLGSVARADRTAASAAVCLGVTVGGSRTDVDGLWFADRRHARLRVRWHTLGQVHVAADGRFRAYRPDVAPGRTFALDRLTIGGAPHVLAHRVQVRLLHRPAASAGDPLADPVRAFVADTVARATNAWQAGELDEPFPPDARWMRSSATAAQRAVGGFLARRDPASAAHVVDAFGPLLDALAAANPVRYRQLIDDLARRGDLSPTLDGPPAPDPLRDLLDALASRARAAADRHPGA